MKRVFVAGLVAVAMLVLGSAGASSASASDCFKIFSPTMETGNYNAGCAAVTEGGRYFEGTLWARVPDTLVWCAKVLPGKREKTEGWPNEVACLAEVTKSAPAEFLRTEVIIAAVGVKEAPTTKEKEEGSNGYLESAKEAKPVKLTSGETKLATAAVPITCRKGKGTGEIIGGTPGTGKATMKFEECEVTSLKCKVKNKGGTSGTIEMKVDTELVNLSKSGSEKGEPPYGELFKTTAKGAKTLVELEFEGSCSSDSGAVTATGEEHGPGIEGVAGFVCKEVEPEAEAETHELNCIEKEQTAFFYFPSAESKTVSEGKAGLEFHKEKGEEIGKQKVELESKDKWLVTAF